MRYFFLLLACMTMPAYAQSSLPPCNPNLASWSGCQGTFTLSNGDKYVGEYSNGGRNGLGIFFYANGDRYVGEFSDGEPHGRGIRTYAYVWPPREGIWESGRFVRAERIPDHIAGRSPTPIGEPNITPDKASSSDVSQTAPRVLIPGLDAIKAKCTELGFKAGTEKFGDCVLKLSK